MWPVSSVVVHIAWYAVVQASENPAPTEICAVGLILSDCDDMYLHPRVHEQTRMRSLLSCLGGKGISLYDIFQPCLSVRTVRTLVNCRAQAYYEQDVSRT